MHTPPKQHTIAALENFIREGMSFVIGAPWTHRKRLQDRLRARYRKGLLES